jgi:hypothetical protein
VSSWPWALCCSSCPIADSGTGVTPTRSRTMTQTMTETPQPHVLASLANNVGDLAGRMGGGFNIVVILWLLVCAVGLWLASDRTWRWPVWTFIVGCVFFWLVAQDAAIFGGLATDLNSLVPMAVLAFCAMPTLVNRAPLPRRLPRELRSSSGAVLASFAAAMVIFSVVTMSWASAVSPPEPTQFLAQDGPAQARQHARAVVHADRSVQQEFFARRPQGLLHAAHVPRPRLLDGLSTVGRAVATGA